MAKPVLLTYQGSVSSFAATKVDRSKVYGSRKRIALDSKNRPCVKASLSADGTQVIKSGMTAQGYFSADGFPISRSEMVGIDPNGNLVESKPSTLGVEQALSGPIAPSDVLDLSLESVFWLDPIGVAEPLLSELSSGKVFSCPFNFTAGLEVETAFILQNGEGVFALVGKPVTPQWVEEGAVFIAEQSEEDEDELDFESL